MLFTGLYNASVPNSSTRGPGEIGEFAGGSRESYGVSRGMQSG